MSDEAIVLFDCRDLVEGCVRARPHLFDEVKEALLEQQRLREAAERKQRKQEEELHRLRETAAKYEDQARLAKVREADERNYRCAAEISSCTMRTRSLCARWAASPALPAAAAARECRHARGCLVVSISQAGG